MAAELTGTFQINEEILCLQLPDGRRFSISISNDGLSISDISWNRFHIGEHKMLTRDAILATEHSTIKCEGGANKALFDFIDIAPIPYPGTKESS